MPAARDRPDPAAAGCRIRPVPDWAFADWSIAAGAGALVAAVGGGPVLDAAGATSVAAVLGVLLAVVVVVAAPVGLLLRRGGLVRFGPDGLEVRRWWWRRRYVRWDRVRGATLSGARDNDDLRDTHRVLDVSTGGAPLRLPVRFPPTGGAGDLTGPAAVCVRELTARGIRVRGLGPRS